MSLPPVRELAGLIDHAVLKPTQGERDVEMIEAGATRLGTSSTPAILDELRRRRGEV